MINELTQEQKDTFPYYAKKWTEIGLKTGPIDFEKAKPLIEKIHNDQNEPLPLVYFNLESPFACQHAMFQVQALSDFDDNWQNTEIYTKNNSWIKIFDKMYEQYSAQYPKVEWNDDVKARMLSKVSYQYANNPSNLDQYVDVFMFGNGECYWLAYYDFFYEHFKEPFLVGVLPFIELANYIGWWAAMGEAVFISDRPSVVNYDFSSDLAHNPNGAIVTYSDGWSVYALNGHAMPEKSIIAPETLTLDDIHACKNAETRRQVMEIYGMDRYFEDAVEEVLDRDFVVVDNTKKEMMPRMLVKTVVNDVFLIGSDGSTNRVYYMPVIHRDVSQINTCKKAHEYISGIPENLCVGQS